MCDYAKSAIDTNNKTVIAISFKCIGTIIKSDSDLSSYSTISSSNNSNDLMYGEKSRKAGDLKSKGKGESVIVGGKGKYSGMKAECEYVAKYHPNSKSSLFSECVFTKLFSRLVEPWFT